MQTQIQLDVFLDPAMLNPDGVAKIDPDELAKADYNGLTKKSLAALFPEVSERREKIQLNALLSSGAAFLLQSYVMGHPAEIGKAVKLWLPASDDVDMYLKGNIDVQVADNGRRINDHQLAWLEKLKSENRLAKRFNSSFFTSGDSREPELARDLWCAHGLFFYVDWHVFSVFSHRHRHGGLSGRVRSGQ